MMEENRRMDIQIAIDGPAAAGKSTVARMLAMRLGGYYVNTGDMYRTVAWLCLQNGLDPERDTQTLSDLLAGTELEYRHAPDGGLQLFLNGQPVPQPAIRAPEVAAIVSQVARQACVRDWMFARQRDCRSLGLIIMEGRDIGTVILPDAPFKFFVTASPEERARRRLAQSGEVAAGATLAEVAAQIAERDRMDSTRPIAPLKPAPDAMTVMTDGLTPAEVVEKLAAVVEAKTGGNTP